MFLNEVALGVEHHITKDNGSFVQAPKGKDCVIGNFKLFIESTFYET